MKTEQLYFVLPVGSFERKNAQMSLYGSRNRYCQFDKDAVRGCARLVYISWPKIGSFSCFRFSPNLLFEFLVLSISAFFDDG